MPSVRDKVVIITGASSGIGEASARLLADKGAKVVLAARRQDRLEEIVAEIVEAGGEAICQTCDVCDKAQVQELVDTAVMRFGHIDVMFNNAGVMPLAPMSALKTDEWDKIIDINIKGVLNGIAAALPVMEAQGHGHIINTASTAGHAVSPTAAVYCASKYAVRAISEGLRQESDTVRVTIISPGVTTTELGHDISDQVVREYLEQLRENSLDATVIAEGVMYAISQPDNVDTSEIILRPVTSPL